MGKKLPIVQLQEKVLRKKAREIPRDAIRQKKIQQLIADMKATIAATPDGVGLAAPQVGEPLRLFIVSEEAEMIDAASKKGYERRPQQSPDEVREKPYEEKEWDYYVFINPVVKNRARRMDEGVEGCLSVRGKFGTVKRYEKITVEAYDEHGRVRTWGRSRFFARVLQHELDHLEGTLFIDKARDVVDAQRREL